MDQNFISSNFETLCQVADERPYEVNQYNNKNVLDSSEDGPRNSNAIYDVYYSITRSSGTLK